MLQPANGRSRPAYGRRAGHPQYEKGALLPGMTATSDSTRVTYAAHADVLAAIAWS